MKCETKYAFFLYLKFIWLIHWMSDIGMKLVLYIYILKKKKLLTTLSFLLCNRAPCLNKQRVLASKGEKFGVVDVMLWLV
jgi:hypothetical protein